MFLKRPYKDERYERRRQECRGYLPLREVLYEGKIYRVRVPCEKKFYTRDPTQVFCSDSCRLNFHYDRRKKERAEKAQQK